MSKAVNQSINTTIISYFGVALGYINLLYLYPAFLQAEQIGLLRTIQDAAILLVPFAQLGLSQSTMRFFPHFAKDKHSTGGFLGLLLVLSMLAFAVFLLIFLPGRGLIIGYFEENASAVGGYTYLILWLTFILLVTSILEAYSRSLLKIVVPNLIRELLMRVFLTLSILIYAFGWVELHTFLLITVGFYGLCLFILVFYLLFTGDFKPNFDFSFLDKKRTADLTKFSLLTLVGTGGYILVGKVDSLMISGMLGLAENAIYTTAFYVAAVIEIPRRAISQVVMPLISRAFERNNLREIETLYKKAAINQFIIGLLLFIGLWANLENIFRLMPNGEVYAAGKYVILIIGAGKLTDMLFGPSSEIIVLSKYYKFNIVLTAILAVLVIVGNQLLIPILGINGAAFSSAFALISFNVVKYIYIYKKFNMQSLSLGMIWVTWLGSLSLFVGLVIPYLGNVYVDIFIRSALITVIFGGGVILSKVSDELTSTLRKLMLRLRGMEE
jgi:O-antigen/teichoic acid export membrane protein